jgi:hypothetical protein
MPNITGDSRQAIAFALLEEIGESRGLERYGSFVAGRSSPLEKNRAEFLATYQECLAAVLERYRRWGAWGTGS